jgi:flavodoxin
MKVLVAYMSQTGNTKKVAETIYGALPEPKNIKPIKELTTLEGYDISFLGFPMHGYGPDKKVKTFLETYVKGRSIALFITHMAPENAPPLQGWIQKFSDASAGANIVGVFDCQGEVRGLMKILVRFHPDPHVRESIHMSQGQPDAARLERARTFANEMMNKLKP